MMFKRSESAKPVDSDWHQFRQLARETTRSTDAWSDEDINEYDLDTARITGLENDRTYIWDADIDTLGSNGTDIRTLDDR